MTPTTTAEYLFLEFQRKHFLFPSSRLVGLYTVKIKICWFSFEQVVKHWINRINCLKIFLLPFL